MKVGESRVSRVVTTGLVAFAACCLARCGAPGSESAAEGQSAESPSETTGSLSVLGRMAVARSLHTATQLPDGHVLIAGGAAPDEPTRSVELFDPRSGRSQPAADMQVARFSHTATLLPNGKVLVVGGFGPGATSAELYDPASDTFTLTGPLTEPHFDAHAAILLDDGEVLLLGGDPSGTGATPTASAEIYDPVTDTFRPTGSMTIPRRPYGVVRLHDGRVLVAGGTTTGKQVVGSAELYDPRTGRFSRTGDLLAARQKHAAAVLPDGSVLVMGGSAGDRDSIILESAEAFDPVLGRFHPAPPLSFRRYKTSAVSLPDGSALVAGGSAELVEVFDVGPGRFFVAAGGRQSVRFFLTATLLADGSVLIAGGYGDRGSDPTVWRLHPLTRAGASWRATLKKTLSGYTRTGCVHGSGGGTAMTTYVALLRGINVGGHKKVAMADLRDLLSRLGFVDPRSLLQSGNLVFACRARSAQDLERVLEAETAKRLALDAAIFVRTAEEWRRVIARNPFPKEARRDPSHFVVQFLKDAPSPANVRDLQAAITGREVARVRGREAYVVYPDTIGESRLTSVLVERKLGTRATGRNWNTVLKVGALVRG